MNRIVLGDLDDELAASIKQLAEREQISIEKAALKLLRNGAQSEIKPNPAGKIGNSLDKFIGTMSHEEAAKIDKAIRELRTVDKSMWR